MKKLIVIFTMIFAAGVSLAFAQNVKAIVTDDNVRIRSGASLKAQVVSKKNHNDKITVYSYSGSGKVVDGVLDYWACISEDTKQWINAFWISELPLEDIYMNGDNDNINHSEYGFNHELLNEFYATFHNFLPLDLTYSEDRYFSPNFEYDKTKLIEIRSGGNAELYDYDGIILKHLTIFDSPLCTITVLNPEITFFCGVHVGMTIEEFCKIFNYYGTCMTELSRLFIETKEYISLSINFEDGKISSIEWHNGI